MIDAWFMGFVLVASLLVALSVALLLVGHLMTIPAAFNYGWRWWLPTLLLPLCGPLYFAWMHRPEFARQAYQLLAGSVLLGMAGVLLYGGGPYLISHMAGGAN